MEYFASTYIALINKNYPRKKLCKADFENCSMRIYNAAKIVTFKVVPHSLHCFLFRQLISTVQI